MPRKLSTEATSTPNTETHGFGGRFRPAMTASHIVYQDTTISQDVSGTGNSFKSSPELRSALNRLIDDRKTTAAAIANAIRMPDGTDRTRVGQGKSVSVRVDTGGDRTGKKKNHK